MDWVVGLFLAFGLLFFWGVWIFGYWLPMAKEHQRQFKRQAERERLAREAAASLPAAPPQPPPARPDASADRQDSLPDDRLH